MIEGAAEFLTMALRAAVVGAVAQVIVIFIGYGIRSVFRLMERGTS